MNRPAHRRAATPHANGAFAVMPWCADRGDGTYRNPVLFADYSDPDAIRTGEDYWLTSSSFSHVPGLPILHSRDLVNWTLVNHALRSLVPETHFAVPRHGDGVWAPSIRFHAGQYWIFYPDPDFGIYAVTAEDPRGRWSLPVLVKAGKGLIDPCPFWEPDGTGYLIHAWAKSRCGIHNRLTLHRLQADSRGVADPGEVVVDGERLAGWHTIEGPKLYFHQGFYYIFAPAGGVASGYQAVFRAPRLYGPYEHRIVLAQGASAVNGPHQGAWVTTPMDTHWFLHFQQLAPYGRVVHLQPMIWRDGWPVIGRAALNAGGAEPVLVAPKPHRELGRMAAPQTSDEFERPALGLQWQWQANPRAEWLCLETRPGWLRLLCVPQAERTTLWSAAHLLTQKFPAAAFEVTTRLQFSPRAESESAGLLVFGFSYAWVGIQRDATSCRVVMCRADDAHQGDPEREVANHPLHGCEIFLRVIANPGGNCEFSFSVDGDRYTPIGEPFHARPSYWVGARIGLFARTVAASAATFGHADFDWFRVNSLG